MMTHEDYMRLALKEARQGAREGEVPVGAVGVYRREVIAQAHNIREREQDPLAHAELAIVRKAGTYLKSWRLEELVLYVTLEPCLMCTGALLQARVQKLIFGAMDPKGGACGSLFNLANDSRLNHQIEVIRGVLANDSEKLLKEFFQRLRG